MKHLSLSALVVAALIMFDATLTMAYAETKVTIFKVTKIAPANTLKMRAWPSTKSKIKVKLPYNAKDLTETGKQRTVSGSKWVEVNWQKKKGWVNARFLKKTGVLLHANKIASRNPKATIAASPSISKVITSPVQSLNDRPQELAGDRYDQTIDDVVAEKVSYSESMKRESKQEILSCNGKKPSYWNIKLDMSNRNIQVKFPQKAGYNVPIKYHAWASANKLRMNIGGTKGRNIIDVNLEKTNACFNDMSKSAFAYEVNATINDQYYSGCCQSVSN
ncbi:MAG: SH3 domain-containing protein [Cocleimonas sp.]